MTAPVWLDEIRWTSDGLVPVITQEASTGKVLMFADEPEALRPHRRAMRSTGRVRGTGFGVRARNPGIGKGVGNCLDCDEDGY